MWTLCTYTYMAMIPENLTLKFAFQASNKYDWYLDDISVKDPTSIEMLTNGYLESNLSITEWNTGFSGSCGSSCGISSTMSHSPIQSYHTTWISQPYGATGDQV
jgi:hypothetical protein